MTFKVVQLRLITWEELPLMKSDIGWVYITHSKVFIPSSRTQYLFFCHHQFEYITIAVIDTCLSTQYYSISYFYLLLSYLICSTVMYLYLILSYNHLSSHCFHTVISYPYDASNECMSKIYNMLISYLT